MQSRRATVTGEAMAEQLAAAVDARAEFEIVRKKAGARAAFDLLLEVDPGSHETRRLHEMIQTVVTEVRGPRARVGVSTHEFNAVRGTDGEVVTEPAVEDARISEWMSVLHKKRAEDPRFSAAAFQSLQAEHARWESERCDAECDASLARAADERRWNASCDDACQEGGAEGPDRDWPGFLASDPAVREVKEALKLIDAGVAPSPQGGEVGQAKLGGEALAETLSVLFAVAMWRGHVPTAVGSSSGSLRAKGMCSTRGPTGASCSHRWWEDVRARPASADVSQAFGEGRAAVAVCGSIRIGGVAFGAA